MSNEAVVHIRALRGLTVTEKAVAYAIASRHDGQWAWPSHATIALDAGCDQRTVKRIVRQLAAKGILSVSEQWDEAGDRTTNRYRFPLLGVVTENHHPVTENHHGGDTAPPRVVTDDHHGGDSLSPKKPLKEKIEKPLKKPLVPAALRAFDAHLQEAPGYAPTPALFAKVIERYSALDLEEEAMKMADWLRDPKRNTKKRTAGTAFILHWLSQASAPRKEYRNGTAPAVARPASGIAKYDLGG